MQHRRYISLVLLLSFSVILGHSIIPHHHHADLFVSAHASSCPSDAPDHHAPDQQSAHCHAFNEIAFYKASLPEMVQPMVVPCFFSVAGDEAETETINVAVTGITIPLKLTPSFILFGRSIVHRGPPCMG